MAEYKRCGNCAYAATKKYGTNVHCSLYGHGFKGISSRACESFEARIDRDYTVCRAAKEAGNGGMDLHNRES